MPQVPENYINRLLNMICKSLIIILQTFIPQSFFCNNVTSPAFMKDRPFTNFPVAFHT